MENNILDLLLFPELILSVGTITILLIHYLKQKKFFHLPQIYLLSF